MKTSHFLQLLLLGALWGASFLFTRLAVPELGPLWLVAVRVLAGALFLLVVASLLRSTLALRGHWRHFFCLGFLNTALPFALFAYAATTLTASLLSIINSTAPLWGVTFGMLLSRQLPAPRIIGGLAAGLIGVSLLVLRDPAALAAGSAWPVVAALLAPVCYGLASHYARLRTAHVAPMAVAHGSMWGALLCLLPLLPFSPRLSSAMLSAGGMAAALALGVLCTGLAYQIYFRLVREIGAASALTVTFLIPLFGILWGALFLQEAVTGTTFVGAAFVLLGTALVTGFNPLALRSQRA
ncbi:MAG TPA: DMT family transporter [Accumulibacter sp.]|nr:DMT family transporter [Accumulibacter sp.]HPP46320.1 DMT family transporter [Accumulibacter sp.]